MNEYDRLMAAIDSAILWVRIATVITGVVIVALLGLLAVMVWRWVL